ncbi:hypothetical protein CVT24_006218 [Panaeolus cyanescens]|uniref:DUF6533 domain-containing protein n=1 Tax=Panaeolus cyanescens TaxID=181874 RepID=A0A409YEE9_9AGAR|nr:hypothetical protein CVT24_006218 [Panaeolus cyanescens]
MLSTVLGTLQGPPKEMELSDLSLLPNPLTPLAFFPPEIAWQASVANYVLVGCLTTLIWDILNNLKSDYMLLTRRKFGLPTAVYFISRLSTLTLQFDGSSSRSAAPIGNCRKTEIIVNAFFPVSIPSSSLLLFFQARAMYLHNRLMVAIFAFLWFAVLATTAPILTTTFAAAIGPTDFCITFATFKPYYTAPLIVSFVYDTTLFLATVFRVYQCSMAGTDSLKTKVETFMFGRHLPTLSKALLQNGQAYFLTTVAVSLTSLVMYYIDALPQSYRLIMGIPDVALINIMACRIYRNTRLGKFEIPCLPSLPSSNSIIRFAPSIPTLEQKQTGRLPPVTRHRLELPTFNSSRLEDLTTVDGTFSIRNPHDFSQTTVTPSSSFRSELEVEQIGPYLGSLPALNSSGLPSTGGLSPTVVQGLLPFLPNPFTPLAFLPPDVARQATVAMFVLVASLTVLLWDILNNFHSDYLLLTRHRFRLPTAVYFFSRITSLAYLLGEVIGNTAPIGHCRITDIAVTVLFPLAIPSTCLLLFFQVRAIYIRNNLLVAFFGFMWVAVVGSCAATVVASTAALEIGSTGYCVMYTQTKSYSTAPAVVVLANDSLMFLAIVYKVFQCSMTSSSDVKTSVKTFLFGSSLPTLSKALLQNGQAYFLSTVGINLITVIMFYITSIPATYRLIIGIPDIVLMNVMACRIYRNTKLGIFSLPTQFPNNALVNRSHTKGVVVVEVSNSNLKHLEKTPPASSSFGTLHKASTSVSAGDYQLRRSLTLDIGESTIGSPPGEWGTADEYHKHPNSTAAMSLSPLHNPSTSQAPPFSLPNPTTPLAFLPPDVARQASVAMFVLVASLTVILWDVLNNIRSDYLLLTRRKVGLPTFVYLFSRIFVRRTNASVLAAAPVGNCKMASVAVNALFPLAIPSTSLLLFFQVRAIYMRNNMVVAFFGLMWIAVVGACTTTVIASRSAVEIGQTNYCIVYAELKSYSSAPAIVVLVNDTLMFMSIVYKALQCSMTANDGVKTGVKTFLFGTSLPALSKALLQNGQAYFLSTVGINLVTVIIFYIDKIPITYRLIIGIPDVVLMNIMACRIYRNTKLGKFNLPAQSVINRNNPPLTGNRTDPAFGQGGSGVFISVTKQMEKSPPSIETLNSTRLESYELQTVPTLSRGS